MATGRHFIGVDVGTGSARAGVFTGDGRLLGSARRDIRIWREGADIVEQSSDDIWAACAHAVRAAMVQAGVGTDEVRGLSFDATCSLVLLDRQMRPVAAGASGDVARNIIVWMDHRAVEQARAINATGDAVLDFVGGAISPEMQTPKLLWLRQHLPQSFDAAAHFFDLTDYLTWRATGSLARSVCTVTCKWTYLAHERRWSDAYFRRIGLGQIVDQGYVRIGTDIVEPGTALAQGLAEAAATAFGLRAGTPVGAGLIDAHAGGVGSMGGRGQDGTPQSPERRIAFIIGTSACAMAVTRTQRFVPGVWGPYYSAMIPGLWLAEAGQSAAGAAIDFLLRSHPAYGAAAAEAERSGGSVLNALEVEAIARTGGTSEAARLASSVHVLPDFLGNRSPFADPDARAVLAGLPLDDSRDGLLRLYVAGLCGLGYGAAQILDALAGQDISLDTIVMCGGAAKSPLVRQIIADATGLAVVMPETAEPVLLGAAMLGAVASGAFADIGAAMVAMSRDATTTPPARGPIAAFHAAKRVVFAEMQALDRRARERMAGIGAR
jgi:FGGY-family pentulose kinase